MSLKYSKVFSVLLLFSITSIISTNVDKEDIALWHHLINATKLWSDHFTKEYKIKFNSLALSANVSQECKISVALTLNAISNLEDWAHELINSWGSFPPSGLLQGTSSDFGAYDQCMSIVPNSVIGQSQYCMVDLSLPLPQPQPIHHSLYHQIDVLPNDIISNRSLNRNVFKKLAIEASFFYWISIRTGICVPEKCSLNDMNALVKVVANDLGLEKKLVQCELNKETKLEFVHILAIFVIGLFVISGLIATIAEAFMPPKKKSIFIEIFSIRNNVKKLFSRQTTENLSCLHGIRVITIFWVILGHTVVWVHFQMFSRSFGVKELVNANINQLFLNVEYGVDTIFFISGLLTSYITLNITKGKMKSFSSFGFLISRFMRLTPQLAIFLLLNFLLPLMSSGPVWRELTDTLMNRCYKNWWLNILYLQNFVNVKEMCAHHTWYTASDMQFHIISFVIMLGFLYSIKLGIILNIATVILFTVISSIIIFTYNLPPAIVNTARDQYFQDYYVELFYYKPYPHGIVFFIGLAFGYIVYKKNFFLLKKTNLYLVWITILLSFWIPLLDDSFWNRGQTYDKVISAFYYPFCRIVWSLSIAALIWCCISGNGGLINKLLSWKAFVPLARLTYSVYLTHAWIVWIFYGSRRERIDLSSYSLTLIFSHNLLMSYTIGALFAIIFESPILTFNKYLLKYMNLIPKEEDNNDKNLYKLTNNKNVINNNTEDLEEQAIL